MHKVPTPLTPAERLQDAITGYLEAVRNLRVSPLGQGIQPPDGYTYTGPEDFLLRHGQFWTSQALPRPYRRRQAKQCFHNAGALVTRDPQLRYVEGMAVRAKLLIPMHHAWTVDPQGLVVDPTWNDPADCAYFGVVFSTELVRAHQSPDNGSLLYNGELGLYVEPWAG